MQSVSVVIVTFNRGPLLLECVRAVLAQSLDVEKVHIINNASTDATDSILKEAGLLTHPKIDYLLLEQNVGGAGGFHAGIERVLQQGSPDWIWIMDDDVVPTPSCLEEQLSFSNLSECIHPLVVYDDGSTHQWEHLFDPNSTYQIGLRNQSFENGKDWCSMMVGCFEGMLISKRVVDKIGLPHKDFFIYGDDGHYGFLASRHTNVIYVKSAILTKKIKPAGSNTPFRVYYDIRNRFLLRAKLKNLYEGASFGGALFLSFMLMHTKNMVGYPFTLEKLRAAVLGWRDGMSGLSGRRRY